MRSYNSSPDIATTSLTHLRCQVLHHHSSLVFTLMNNVYSDKQLNSSYSHSYPLISCSYTSMLSERRVLEVCQFHRDLKLKKIVLACKPSVADLILCINFNYVFYFVTISEKKWGGMLSGWPRKCRYAIPVQFKP